MTIPVLDHPEPAPAPADTTRFRVVAIARVAVALLAVGLLVGRARSRPEGPSAFVELGAAVALPDVELLDTDGRPYRLAERADGRLTLLFFGYTNCPDACPTQMAVLGRVFRDLPNEVRDQIDMVFVTTDPPRDTPAVLKEYLGSFDSRFIGLTGPLETLAAAQIAAGVPVAVAEPPKMESGYLVGHATQVLVFDRDGFARRAYPFGVRTADWLHDLPLLVSEEGAS